MPPIGTKNLGLIKAIHVGVNPPLNTRILWYNDSTNPYTTGPAKVHYYYDVIVADWMPLAAGATINGIYTYIGFASTCDGSNFSLSFTPDDHCFWAVITSNTPIPLVNLTPDLFEKRWTKFCKCGGSEGSGNYTYIAFADDCDGSNFGLEMQYEVECDDCKYADTFIESSGNSSFSIINTGDGVEITMNNVAPGQQLILDVRTLGVLLLDELTKYCVSIDTLPSFSGEMEISLGEPTDTITINGPVTGFKQLIINQGSKLIIKVPNNGQALINSVMTIKVGSKECCAENEDGKCLFCRCYFGIITSSTPISELTPDLFENRWIKICCDSDSSCDCGENFNLLEQQIINLNELFQDQIHIHNLQISNLTKEISNLQSQLVECCEDANNRISNLEILLNETITAFQESLDGLNNTAVIIGDNISSIEDSIKTENLLMALDKGIRGISDQQIAVFKTSVYDSDREADLQFVNESINESKDYTDEQTTSINTSIRDISGRVSGHEERILKLENPS